MSCTMAWHKYRVSQVVLAVVAVAMLSLSLCSTVCYGQLQTTHVQDTVFNADGTYATGTIKVTWAAFTTAAGNAVPAGNIEVTIGSNGAVSFDLAPNDNSTPAGSYYTATYNLGDGTASKEYWVVPSVSNTTIAAIQSEVMPASVAVQTLTATQVNSMLNQYLPLSGGSL